MDYKGHRAAAVKEITVAFPSVPRALAQHLWWAAGCVFLLLLLPMVLLRLVAGVAVATWIGSLFFVGRLASAAVGARFTFGVGVGYLEPEFRAIGADFGSRGAVTDEYLDAMEALWYDEHPEFHGRFADFGGVDAYPRPAQRPVPIVIGGHTKVAYHRAVA